MPGRSPPDGVPPPLRVGGLPVSALEALASYWSQVLGAVRPEGRIPHLLQGFASPPLAHIPIWFQTYQAGSPRRYLSFCVGDAVYQFRALCFGLSSAPQVFTRVMAPVSSIMHRHGFRLLRYLDDWLVLGSTFQELVRARDFLLWLCRLLGIIVNPSKSSLVPTQTLDFLGMTLVTSPLRVFPTLKRVQKFSLLLQDFLSDRLHPVSVWRSLLVMMSPMSAIVPGSCLRMRSLQLRLNAAGPLLLGGDLVSWDDGCLRDLSLFSDASDQGWGAALGDLHLSGLWSPLCSRFSINQCELLAILYAIQGFLPHLRGRSVAMYSDNSTAFVYLRKQGGALAHLP